MNTEIQADKPPGWLKAWLAVGSALVVFRVCKFAWAFYFFGVQLGRIPCPVPVIAFLHRWDSVLVPASSLAAAVLVARWVEEKFLPKGKRMVMMAAMAFTIAACFPVIVQIRLVPVMMSPLEIAVRQNYSVETVEALIDRYPRLVNGSGRPEDRFEPLFEAAFDSKTNLVKLLIQKGADVDGAIRRAQELNDENAVKLILDCSTNLQSPNPTNRVSPGR